MSVKNLPIEVTLTSADQHLPLGTEWLEDDGDGRGPKVWVYVQNSDAADWAVGDIIGRKDAAATKLGVLAPLDANPIRVMGAVQHIIKQNHYGFIQKRGIATVKADTATAIAANTPVVVGTGATAGRLESDASPTAFEAAVGWAHVAIAVNATGLCYIDCRG